MRFRLADARLAQRRTEPDHRPKRPAPLVEDLFRRHGKTPVVAPDGMPAPTGSTVTFPAAETQAEIDPAGRPRDEDGCCSLIANQAFDIMWDRVPWLPNKTPPKLANPLRLSDIP
ncbi:hypothetical protein GCM10011335_47340 [Aureimonas glaciei]|uniref:Uncharacterized protein n=1 Tax=Aureimonas glaciei TaxID=1776957 RepID=A0A916YCG4_9HYPH|nr:hypothetical protein GCM10011335_47340 [Aureimonas glaciei]